MIASRVGKTTKKITLLIVPVYIFLGLTLAIGYIIFSTSSTPQPSEASEIPFFASPIPAKSYFFNHPSYGIVVDSQNNIYVSDTNNDRIMKVSNNGDVITFGESGSGDGQLDSPRYLAVDNSDNIYVVDADNNRVQKFSPDGTHLLTFGDVGTTTQILDKPIGIALDSDGNIYVTELRQVHKYAPDGSYIIDWGQSGSADGDLYSPQDVAVDSENNVYVAERLNHRVSKFDSDGNFILTWGSQGSGAGQFSQPYGIAIDANDNVYVSETNRIQAFTKDGAYIAPVTTTGTAEGQGGGYGIEFDSSNNLYLMDTVYKRIQKLDADGNFIESWTSRSEDGGKFYRPIDIAVDSIGNIFVGEAGNVRISKFDRYGNFLTTFKSTPLGNISAPSTIAVDHDDNFYTGSTGGVSRITKFDNNGTYITRWDLTGNAYGMDVDSENNIYVVDGTNTKIVKYDSNGTVLSMWGTAGSGPGELSAPHGLAIDSEDNVYISDMTTDRVQKFDSEGNYLMGWGSSGTGNGQFAQPRDLTVDLRGFVYVVDYVNENIQKFDSSGNFITAIGQPGTETGQFDHPSGIFADSRNRLLIADYDNHRIQMYKHEPSIIYNSQVMTVTNLDNGLDTINPSDLHTGLSRNIRITQTDNLLIADTQVNISDTLSWYNSLSVDTDNTQFKAVADVADDSCPAADCTTNDLDGTVADSFSLYVPRDPEKNSVFLCPDAQSLDDIAITCNGGMFLLNDSTQTSTVSALDTNMPICQASLNNTSYWKIDTFNEGGAIALNSSYPYSYTVTNETTGEPSNHTIEFGTVFGLTEATDNLIITFDPSTSAFDLSSLSIDDIDLAVDGTDKVLDATTDNDIWGVAIDVDSDTITFNPPLNESSEDIPAQSTYTVEIGLHADDGQNQIINPDETGSYEVSVMNESALGSNSDSSLISIQTQEQQNQSDTGESTTSSILNTVTTTSSTSSLLSSTSSATSSATASSNTVTTSPTTDTSTSSSSQTADQCTGIATGEQDEEAPKQTFLQKAQPLILPYIIFALVVLSVMGGIIFFQYRNASGINSENGNKTPQKPRRFQRQKPDVPHSN